LGSKTSEIKQLNDKINKIINSFLIEFKYNTASGSLLRIPIDLANCVLRRIIDNKEKEQYITLGGFGFGSRLFWDI
jgi:hypothetical protein